MSTLEEWLVLLEKRHPRAIDLGLERCGTVYRQMGSPRPAIRVITVAGTNGKGSTVAYLAEMSRNLGLRVGSYTSPHILRFNERISIMGEPVTDHCLVAAFERVEAVRGDISLTYFEFTTLAAFLIMNQAELDCAILEVGLGGRLDTTNLVDTDCAVITPIGLDHQDFLGNDLDTIATEKAGIMRQGVPVVCSEEYPPAPILQLAASLNAPVYQRGLDFDLNETTPPTLTWSLGGQSIKIPRPPMAGRHQGDNLAAALTALSLVFPARMADESKIVTAITNTRVPGRLQTIGSCPAFLLDVGHNTLAAEAVAAHFHATGQDSVICILAMLKGKPVESVVHALDGVCSRWLCADSGGDRGQQGEDLAGRVKDALPAAFVTSEGSIETAIDAALAGAGKDDTILVFGSFSAVSDALACLQNSNQHGGHDTAKISTWIKH
jgi:dihydrofolate synthase/folylpolyglutamate synthase